MNRQIYPNPFLNDWVGVQYVDYRPNNRHVVYTSRQNEFFNFHAVTSSNSPDIGGEDHFLDAVDQVRFDEEEESEYDRRSSLKG